jgi:hypothetical protein
MHIGMDIKSISEMYMEAHTVSHTRTRLKGDVIVNSVIDATLIREAEYTRKKSTTSEAEATFYTVYSRSPLMAQSPLSLVIFPTK